MSRWRIPTGLVTAAGLVLGGLPGPGLLPAVWCGLGAIGLLPILLPRRFGPVPFRILPVLLLGMSSGGLRSSGLPPPLPAFDSVTLAGRVLRWETGEAGVRCLLEVRQAAGVRLSRPRRVRVLADGSWGDAPRASWIRASGRLVPHRGRTTPGAYAPGDLAGLLLADRRRPPEWGPLPPGLLLRWRVATERRIGETLPGFPGRFARAVILGNPRALEWNEREMFRRTGTSHLTAVSGLHVGLVAVLTGLVLCAAPSGLRLGATAAAAWCYAGLAGWAASALRAAALVAGATLGSLCRRPRSPVGWLALAVPWLLWSGPELAGSVSFRLSVGAVAGILLALEITGMTRTRRDRWLAPAAVSLGAQWGTLPTVIATFGALAPGALLPNLAVVPLAGLFLPAALLSLAPVPGAGLFQDAAAGVAALIGRTLRLASGLPFLTRIPPPHPLAMAMFPAVLLMWFSSPAPVRTSVRFRAAVIAAMVAAAAACFLPLAPPRGPWCAFLDVGQGDAAVCRLSDGTVWLVDTGDDRGPADAARLAVLPFLRNRRISALDGMVVSHRHRDHVGALESLLDGVPVQRIFDTGYGGTRATAAWMDTVCWERGRVPCLVAAGDTLHRGPGLSLVVLHPPRGDPSGSPPGGNLNEASLMVRLADRGLTVLLAGDGEHHAEAACVAGKRSLSADVLKVGHHGSRTSSSGPFLAEVHPRLAVISCGADNRFGHPAPETLDKLNALGIRVLRTDREGTILVRPSADTLAITLHPPLRPRLR